MEHAIQRFSLTLTVKPRDWEAGRGQPECLQCQESLLFKQYNEQTSLTSMLRHRTTFDHISFIVKVWRPSKLRIERSNNFLCTWENLSLKSYIINNQIRNKTKHRCCHLGINGQIYKNKCESRLPEAGTITKFLGKDFKSEIKNRNYESSAFQQEVILVPDAQLAVSTDIFRCLN